MSRILTFDDFYDLGTVPEPQQIEAIYNAGLQGSQCQDPSLRTALLGNTPTFYQAFPFARGLGERKVILPYRAAQALDPSFVGDTKEAQRQGDCVGKMVANAGTIDYSIDALFGETTFQGRFADENIYRARGHSGEGANCETLAHYVGPQGAGGFLTRKVYTSASETVDLSSYNPSWSKSGSRGVPSWLNDIAKQNKAIRLLPCESLTEVRDALALGFGVGCCGGEGYNGVRNEDGVMPQQGSWSHAKLLCGYDGTDAMTSKYGDPGIFLMAHDWGAYGRGPTRHENPVGSWWVSPKGSVRNNWFIAICSVRGYNRVLDFTATNEISKLMDQHEKLVQLSA